VGESPIRLFFAALPDTATRDLIAAAAQALPLEADARRVPAANYHVTLAFVGEVPAAQVPLLLDIGRGLRQGNFTVRFDAYEYWPKPEAVVAAARSAPAALERLWQALHRALARHRWALEPKRLRPHVSLARKVSQAPVLQAMSWFDWPVSEFSLMRSDLGAAQPAYTVVDTWPLLDDAAET
jgi:RNA 2',3'-cyclic 3'-phosphodiesterase